MIGHKRRVLVWAVLSVALSSHAAAQRVERANLSATNTEGHGDSEGAAMSPDARFVLFESTASDIVAGDTNGVSDVFLRDRQAGTTVRVSLGGDGREPNAASYAGGVSADGTLCVFRSAATTLAVPAHSGRYLQVFLRDLKRQTTTQLSVEPTTMVNGAMTAGITPDGRFIIWSEDAPMNGSQMLSGTAVHDRVTGVTRRLRPPAGFGAQTPSPTWDPVEELTFFPRVAEPGVSAGATSLTLLGLLPNRTRVQDSWLIPGRTEVYALDGEGRIAGADGTLRVRVTPALQVGMPALFPVYFESLVHLRHNMRGPRSAVLSASGSVVAYEHSTVPIGASVTAVSGIFVQDLATDRITLVSRRADGSDAGTNCEAPALSADGLVVAFQCWTSRTGGVYVRDLVSGAFTTLSEDRFARTPALSGNGRYVAFVEGAADESVVVVVDRQAGERRIVSRHLPDTVGYRGAYRPVFSDDGTSVLFTSAAANLVDGDRNGARDVFIAQGGGWPCPFEAWPATVNVPRGGALTFFYLWTMPTCGWEASVSAPWLTLLGQSRGAASGGFFVRSATNDGVPRSGSVLAGTAAVPVTQQGTTPPTNPGSPGDTDGDTLLDSWEQQFGLLTSSASGDNGADGDPDGDGLSNATEQRAGTHPRGTTTRYFAEGSSSSLFKTRLALLNPGAVPATMLLRFSRGDGTSVSHVRTLGARQRATIDPAATLGEGDHEFSTVIESDQLVVADRTMTWGGAAAYGSHAETAVLAPASTWYLAEGATHSGFDLFYLLQNPHPVAVDAELTYLRPPPLPPLVKTYTLPASSRFNVWVNGEARADPRLAPLGATDVSAIIRTAIDRPIIVERAMYLSRPTQVFAAGHESAGITEPATSWFLAEGATGPYFDLFILIANPGATDAALTATYLLPDGTTHAKSYVVPASSRFNIWVDEEQFPDGSGSRLLANTAVSTILRSTNGVPVIVERAMWWPGPTAATWHEAHNSPGSTATSARWALAEGEVGGPAETETYVLIANTATTPGLARVTFIFEDGTSAAREVVLTAQSRANIAVGIDVPETVGRRFGVLVESLGDSPAQLVVERAMYSSAAGVRWAAGTNALGTRLP